MTPLRQHMIDALRPRGFLIRHVHWLPTCQQGKAAFSDLIEALEVNDE